MKLQGQFQIGHQFPDIFLKVLPTRLQHIVMSSHLRHCSQTLIQHQNLADLFRHFHDLRLLKLGTTLYQLFHLQVHISIVYAFTLINMEGV